MATTTTTTLREQTGATSAASMPSTPWTGRDILKALGLVVVAWIVIGAISLLAASLFLDSGEDVEDNATALTIVFIGSMIGQELALLGGVLWFTVRKYHVSLATLGLRKPQLDEWWFPGAIAAAALALIYGYIAALSAIGVSEQEMPDQVFDNVAPFAVVAVGAVLLAPVIEETFFRGFIFGGLLGRWGWLTAAGVSSLVFGLAHLSLYVIIPFTGVGFLFAWSYRRTGSIIPGIVAHTLVNAISLGISFAIA